jgi:kynureninase
MSTRRTFLRDASLLGAASLTLASTRAAAALDRLHTPPGSAADLARDEAFWARVAAQYRVSSDVTNLEGVSFGMIAVPVLDAFHRNADRANDGGSYFARREFGRIFYGVRGKIAAFVGAKSSELMVSSNATEALRAIIVHYNRVGPGDTVMYADLDFNAMQWAMHELAARRCATVARLDIPEPATHDSDCRELQQGARRTSEDEVAVADIATTRPACYPCVTSWRLQERVASMSSSMRPIRSSRSR